MPQYQQNTVDYDLRGYGKETDFQNRDEGHMTDTYKKPNHPTFSTQSQYSGRGTTMSLDELNDVYAPEGGYWMSVNDKSFFVPSTMNRETVNMLNGRKGAHLNDRLKTMTPEILNDIMNGNDRELMLDYKNEAPDGRPHPFANAPDPMPHLGNGTNFDRFPQDLVYGWRNYIKNNPIVSGMDITNNLGIGWTEAKRDLDGKKYYGVRLDSQGKDGNLYSLSYAQDPNNKHTIMGWVKGRF